MEKLKYIALKREITDIEKCFVITGIDYDSSKEKCTISYTDGYIKMKIIYEYIEKINFWSISKIQ